MKEIIHTSARDNWNWIKRHITTIIAQQRLDCTQEDIYHLLISGKSSLYINKESDAFIILSPTSDSHNGKRGVFIDIAYCPSWRKAEDYAPAIYDLCRSTGAEYIEFASNRKGWARMFNKQHTLFRGSL